MKPHWIKLTHPKDSINGKDDCIVDLNKVEMILIGRKNSTVLIFTIINDHKPESTTYGRGLTVLESADDILSGECDYKPYEINNDNENG